MTALAASVFLEVLFALLIAVPVVILWLAAVFDVLRHGGSGLRIAATLVLILIVPILGSVLYFVFRRPTVSAEHAQMAQADLRREAGSRPVGGTGLYR